MLVSLAVGLHVCIALAQLTLPDPPYLPPDASSGTRPSAASNPNSQWSTLLGNLLYFYEAQRSGSLPSSTRVSWDTYLLNRLHQGDIPALLHSDEHMLGCSGPWARIRPRKPVRLPRRHAQMGSRLAREGTPLQRHPVRPRRRRRDGQRVLGRRTAGGLLFYDGDSDSASLNPALNAAMLLMRYAPLASSDEKRSSYEAFAQQQLDYALGNNPMSVPYIVGSNPNSPSNPHSAAASGANDSVSNIDTEPAQEAHVVYGAVVGGPDERDRFFDVRSDWPQTEAALDYTAPMLALAAMQLARGDGAGATEDPYFVRLQEGAYVRPRGAPCDAAIREGCAGPRMSFAGQMVMGVVIGVVGLVVFGLLAMYVYSVRGKGGGPS